MEVRMKKVFSAIFIAIAVVSFSANAAPQWHPSTTISAIYMTNTFFQFTLVGESNMYRVTETEVGSLFYERLISQFSTSYYKQAIVSFDYDTISITGGNTFRVLNFYSGR
jgi:hypothetical protein